MRTKHRLPKRYAKQVKGRVMKSTKRQGIIIDDNIRAFIKFLANCVLLLLCVTILVTLMAMTTGCSGKTEIIEKPVIVYKPVPTQCDFNITRPPMIDINSTHSLLSSITELSIDSVMLRKQIKAVPCLNVFEIK